MGESTREKFLSVAAKQFAEKGFYGASIASIATELDLTKQALLHHFGSKEKLYAEILQGISNSNLRRISAIRAQTAEPKDQLEAVVVGEFEQQYANPVASALIMRELLDNERRAEKAGNWFLKPYLDALVDIVLGANVAAAKTRPEALALVYQLLGAAMYLPVSVPTLSKMYGKRLFEELRAGYSSELRRLVQSRLNARD
ncbi:MAG: TetR/AcrR family transcriptional regulator [Pseudomonadota bacterium]